jgi:hypothetical protein
MLLRARINAMVESGRLEIRGQSERDIFDREVRLSQPGAAAQGESASVD